MNKINYQKEMERIIKENCAGGSVTKKVLLHSCCGPCSTYCIQTLAEYFEVTVFYYNPNIYPEDEYHMRAKEQKRFIEQFPTKNNVDFIEGLERRYGNPSQELKDRLAYELGTIQHMGYVDYFLIVWDFIKYAKDHGFDFFTTTLSISPLKNAEKLNEIGGMLEKEYGVGYLYSDFKKKDGYKKSTAISKEYNMYRQYYCGCVFSKKQRDEEIRKKKEAGIVE